MTVWQRTGVITVFAVICAQIGAYLSAAGFGPDVLAAAQRDAFLIAVAIAAPVSWRLSGQSERLKRVNAELLKLNSELDSQRRHAEYMARRDAATGLFNRPNFVAEVRLRAKSAKQLGTLAMIDADRFKAINDNFGHEAGDAAIMAIADAMRDEFGDDAVLGRLGGEEFGVYIPDSDLSAMRKRAERLRKMLAATDVRSPRGRGFKLTVSAGLSELALYSDADRGADVEAALSLADARLYVAKETGRNRIIGPAHHKIGSAVA